mmetsp:Transcript_7941/g.14955  ORF Transcript_7941/g.14955 Transcript_7941/m.14955 type:complete len:1059 (+) Transcript_7941:348-3524(+)|eukprot:CAMPEP_0176489950 /NCGR_PEP_ID=MMETSP0200_2-20121128/7590_1 /TAXON_ID=947934 /ORGANISM="Chaetoceros sp., Strain GSL56" /LENGTH=1058 /DNA_ID=CAMNT_0017887183 /DNA_START=345 /DNA_END=3521 /DNA_ORIENTATION=+
MQQGQGQEQDQDGGSSEDKTASSPQKTAAQQASTFMNQSSHLFSSLNFDDDNDLQNLDGLGYDGDLPDMFWDYGDVGNMAYSEDGGSITASSLPGMESFPTNVSSNMSRTLLKSFSSIGPSATAIATAPAVEDSAPFVRNEQQTHVVKQGQNMNLQQQEELDNMRQRQERQRQGQGQGQDKNTQQAVQQQQQQQESNTTRMNTAPLGNPPMTTNWVGMVPQQVQNPLSSLAAAGYPSSQMTAGNFCGVNPFFLPPPSSSTSSSSNLEQNQVGTRTFSQNSLTSSMFDSSVGQQGVDGSCSLLSKDIGNNLVALNNQQQQAQQQAAQQYFQGSYFGLPQAQLQAQFNAWQANNQIQKLNEYIQQQFQARNNLQQQQQQQQQFLQQQLYAAGGLLPSNNEMLPPPQQQQLLPNQGQMRLHNTLQMKQKTHDTSADSLLTLQVSTKSTENLKKKQKSQQLQRTIQPNTQQQRIASKATINPLLRGTDKIVSQNYPPTQFQQHGNVSEIHPVGGMIQAQSAKKGVLNTQNMGSLPRNQLQPPITTSLPNNTLMFKSNIVSCSDTDGDHVSDAVNVALTSSTRNKRSPSSTLSTAQDKSQAYPDDFFDDHQMEHHDDDDDDDDEGSETKRNEDEMTEEEKAVANRKRNREHARNTRARKKAYLESLKTTLDELCRERDSLVSERVGAASMLLEVQKTRTDVLLSFFALRCKYEKKRALWSSILDESFTCIMPVTPYRSFPASEVQISKCQRTVMGVDGIMGDTASLHVLLNSLVDRSRYPNGKVEFRYTLIAEEAVVSGNQMMARWSLTTTNAIALGAKREVKKMGMLCARFSSSHKILSLELMFDVMAFMLQLKQSTGNRSFVIVPNTVQSCSGCFENYPMVMTLAERPYTIVQVNKEWEEMTGWTADEVVGKKSCKILQGEDTEQDAVKHLTTSILYQRPDFCMLTNYTRERQKMFRNFFNIYPISTDSKITHYVGLTVHIEWLDCKTKPRNPTFTTAENNITLDDSKIGIELRKDLKNDIDSGSVNGPSKVTASNVSSYDESTENKKSSYITHNAGDIRN